VREELPGLVGLVQAFGVARHEEERIVDGATEAEAQPHASDAYRSVYGATVFSEVPSDVRRRPNPRAGLRQRETSAAEMDYARVARHRNSPAPPTDAQTIVEIIPRPE
jgi:hypothetical protein